MIRSAHVLLHYKELTKLATLLIRMTSMFFSFIQVAVFCRTCLCERASMLVDATTTYSVNGIRCCFSYSLVMYVSYKAEDIVMDCAGADAVYTKAWQCKCHSWCWKFHLYVAMWRYYILSIRIISQVSELHNSNLDRISSLG